MGCIFGRLHVPCVSGGGFDTIRCDAMRYNRTHWITCYGETIAARNEKGEGGGGVGEEPS